MRINRHLRGLFVAVFLSGACAAAQDAELANLEEPEIQAALEAAPSHLREGAGVYVSGPNGYRRARESSNGFNCLIAREVTAAFEPRCYDAEGSASLLPVLLFRAEQRARGTARADLDREVAGRYARGEYFAPRRVSVCYMLSMRNMVVVDREVGRVGRVGPRLLFYAPNLRNEDFGATPDLESRFLVADDDSQSSMIIVPVASARRARTYYYSPEGLSPLTKAPVSASTDAGPIDSLGQLTEDESMAIEQPKPPAVIDPFAL